ncbi:hypothetical protein [Zeimonas arvi]|uniref:hypothetical protein n=1 Tax=Zeimonas arvi TaxID=2498847 RepID=UPI00164EE502|nr:hypothetical protein [Zeimonas arvi]
MALTPSEVPAPRSLSGKPDPDQDLAAHTPMMQQRLFGYSKGFQAMSVETYTKTYT